MLMKSQWALPDDDTFLPYILEANISAFSSLYNLLSFLFLEYCGCVKAIQQPSGSQPETKHTPENLGETLIHILKILDANVQFLLTKNIDIMLFHTTTVRRKRNDGSEEDVLLLNAFKDILQSMVSNKATCHVSKLQEAANTSLTLGLDLWFRDTDQQLELLNAILQDTKRILSEKTSKAIHSYSYNLRANRPSLKLFQIL